MKKLNLPVGVSDFSEIRENAFYYVDKSELIAELLKDKATKVTLITRPRRFGKTMVMRMLGSFFDIRRNSSELFEGLAIKQHVSLCQEWMNRWPTIFVTFKRVDGLNFDNAYAMLASVIEELYVEHQYLLDAVQVSEYDREGIRRIVQRQENISDIKNSLELLIRAMRAYYGKPVVLLMDEYDVPMAKASSHGYYQEMMDVMKGMMQALKDNDNLQLAIITGCLRIAKESIFTGTNNLVSDTITKTRYDEFFGFTQAEVARILKDADAENYAEKIKNWYDGYHFGECDVYCPWDVMNYLRELQHNPEARPESYWRNTSDNAIIRSFIDYVGSGITRKLETLLSGGYILQRIDENMTYDYLHSSEDNFWSILYLTGYLTGMRKQDLPDRIPDHVMALVIPNEEIKEIFETTVMQWFDDNARLWNRKLLFDAVWSGNTELITQEMNKLLRKTISYHDYREDYYHAFLAGIFAGAGYIVESNREHGEGRSDIVVYDTEEARVAVFEAKYAKKLEDMDRECEDALDQIDARMYAKDFEDDYDQVLCYGISFFKKRCLVRRRSLK